MLVRPAGVLFRPTMSLSLALCREYENLKEARKASGELADKLKKDLFSSRSKVPVGSGGCGDGPSCFHTRSRLLSEARPWGCGWTGAVA